MASLIKGLALWATAFLAGYCLFGKTGLGIVAAALVLIQIVF